MSGLAQRYWSYLFLGGLWAGLCMSVYASGPAVVDGDTLKTANTTLTALVDGNRRFQDDDSDHPNSSEKRRQELMAAQKPKAIVLSCADSRVPPEVVFDQGLGDLFVVRTAGHVADRASVASIEYAVEHLGVPLLVVLGHESCGAVHAALQSGTLSAHTTTGPHRNLDELLAKINPHIQGFKTTQWQNGGKTSDPLIRGPVKSHIGGVVRDLMLESSLIRQKVMSGQLLIVTGLYELAQGRVDLNSWTVEQLSGMAGEAEQLAAKESMPSVSQVATESKPKVQHQTGRKPASKTSESAKIKILKVYQLDH